MRTIRILLTVFLFTYIGVVSAQTSGNQKVSVLGYNLNITINGQGTVTPENGNFSGTIYLEAIPDEGYKFAGWTGDLGGMISPIPLVMGSNKDIIANFVKEDAPLHKVSYTIEGEGFVLTSYQYAYEGTIVRFNARPDAGYVFALWRNMPSFGQETTVDVEVTDSINMIAAFVPFSPTTYYVSPEGDDNNDGSEEHPYKTIVKAFNKAKAGNVIYVMPGEYLSPTTYLKNNSGKPGNYIHVVAYDMQNKPIIKTSVKIVDCSYIHFKGLTITQNNINVYGEHTHHNIFDQIEVHHIFNTEVAFNVSDRTHDNLFINCDMHNNVYHSGSNCDGIAMWGTDGTTSGPYNNTLKYCRSYFNNDDGFDIWWGGSNIRFEGCWSFGNGKDEDFNDIEGDGNGFKLGQGQPSAVLINCLAFKNRNTGFDQNSNTGGGITLLNCSAFQNDYNNFDFWAAPKNSIVRNCMSFDGNFNLDAADDQYNSWNFEDINISDDDFLSMDYFQNVASRNPDGSLPESNFLHLKQNSKLINRGIEVGLPYSGSAPDLGAFEFIESSSSILSSATSKINLHTYPNPMVNNVTIQYFLNAPTNVKLSIINTNGTIITVLINEKQQQGEHFVSWNGTNQQRINVADGIYIIKLSLNNGEILYHKIILQK